MKTFLSLFSLSALVVLAQQPGKKAPSHTAPPVDPSFHADVLSLLELDGTKENIQQVFEQGVESVKAQIMKNCHACTPDFAAEWEVRFRARVKPDDLVEIAARAYERHLNHDEIKEFTAFVKARKYSAPAKLSPALTQKLQAVIPAVSNEIKSGCARITQKYATQVGQEMSKEYPEMMNDRPAAHPE